MNVGNMLYDGRLSEAKQYAERKMAESPSNLHVQFPDAAQKHDV
jgi:hypothetical protein